MIAALLMAVRRRRRTRVGMMIPRVLTRWRSSALLQPTRPLLPPPQGALPLPSPRSPNTLPLNAVILMMMVVVMMMMMMMKRLPPFPASLLSGDHGKLLVSHIQDS